MENNNYNNGFQNGNYVNNINGVSKTVLILSIVISLLIGAIGGYFVGETRYGQKVSNSNFYAEENKNSEKEVSIDNSQNTTNNENEINIDFSQYPIGNSDFTIDTYYSDEESKLYASKIIGKEVPNITWKDAAGNQYSTDELEGDYIIEFFMTTCGYCQNAIPEVDAFREAHSDKKVISLAFDAGDLTNFNASGENAFHISNLNTSAEVAEFTNNIPFVPAVIYVRDGMVQLLTFGGPTQDSMEDAMIVAYGE